jgi:hypothetical protein
LSDDDTVGGVISFAPLWPKPGTPPGAKWSDAHEFQKQARDFARIHGGDVVLYDNHIPMRQRAQVLLDAIARYQGKTKLICIAHFGHGWSRGIQIGIDIRGGTKGITPDELAKALVNVAGPGIILATFSCSAGDAPVDGPATDGSFCDETRDALCRHGMISNRVFGHKTAGHTSYNPFALFFDGKGESTGGIGGEWVIPPPKAEGYDRDLWLKWKKIVLNPDDDLDLRVPFLEIRTIRALVMAAKR